MRHNAFAAGTPSITRPIRCIWGSLQRSPDLKLDFGVKKRGERKGKQSKGGMWERGEGQTPEKNYGYQLWCKWFDVGGGSTMGGALRYVVCPGDTIMPLNTVYQHT